MLGSQTSAITSISVPVSVLRSLSLSDGANLVQFNHTIGTINAHNRRDEPLETIDIKPSERFRRRLGGDR